MKQYRQRYASYRSVCLDPPGRPFTHPTFILPVLLLLLLISAATAVAERADWQPVSEQWYVLELNDEPMGWVRETVEKDEQHYRTTTEHEITMRRGNETATLAATSVFIETRSGDPVSAHLLQNYSRQPRTQQWTFTDEGIRQEVTNGGKSLIEVLPLPEGVWLTPQAAQQYWRKRVEAGAEEITFRTLDPESGAEPITFTSHLQGKEELTINGRTLPVTVWKTTDSRQPLPAIEKVSADGHSLWSQMDSPLGKMVTRLVDKAEAEALAEGDHAVPEVMISLLVNIGQPIPDDARRAVYRLRLKDERPVPDLPSVGSQRIEPQDDGSVIVEVDVQRSSEPVDEADAAEANLRRSSMIDPDDPLVRKLAERAVRRVDEDSDRAKKAEAMRRLVHHHISRKDMSTAFASAAETARTRRGDCTEHAVLLAAMLRSQDIPARTASGLVFVPFAEGQRNVFGWHMWTQALIEGRWMDFDAAMPTRFSAGHICTGTSPLNDGAPETELNQLMLLIGNLDIEVVRIEREEDRSNN